VMQNPRPNPSYRSPIPEVYANGSLGIYEPSPSARAQ